VGRPGAELRIPRPAGEVGVGLVIGYAFHRALDPYLPPQALPMEEEGCARVFGELIALRALLVGVEYETVRPMSLEQDHAHRRPAVAVRGRQRHRFGVIDLCRSRFREPFIEQGKGVGHAQRALGLASRKRQPIWSARNGYGMEAIWHSISTNASACNAARAPTRSKRRIGASP